MVEDVKQAVRAKVEKAELQVEPFPHVVVPDLLPEEAFRRLAESVPPLDAFEILSLIHI